MKKFDRYLQNTRFSKARRFINKGDRVLDIGADDGIMFEKFGSHIGDSVGIEPTLDEPVKKGRHRILPGYFPDALPAGQVFDVITMLAVLEHIPPEVQKSLGADCARFLAPGGRAIITVP